MWENIVWEYNKVILYIFLVNKNYVRLKYFLENIRYSRVVVYICSIGNIVNSKWFLKIVLNYFIFVIYKVYLVIKCKEI